MSVILYIITTCRDSGVIGAEVSHVIIIIAHSLEVSRQLLLHLRGLISDEILASVFKYNIMYVNRRIHILSNGIDQMETEI